MESPLLRAGVAAAQQALGLLSNVKSEVKKDEVKSEAVVKTEIKKEISPAVLHLHAFWEERFS